MAKTFLIITTIFALFLLTACASGVQAETPANLSNSSIGQIIESEQQNNLSVEQEDILISMNSAEGRAILLEQSGISEYGLQVATDFLIGFTSIFTGVVQAETYKNDDWISTGIGTGRFILGWDSENQKVITTYEVPEIYYALSERGIRGVYDKYGNQINDAIWLQAFHGEQRSSYFYASHFTLYNFDNGGIPVIFIFFRPIFDGMDTAPTGSYTIFIYVDGEYQELEWRNHEEPSWPWTSSWVIGRGHQLFFDDEGRIVTFSNDIAHGTFSGYEHLVLTNQYATLYPIVIRGYDDGAAWQTHHWYLWDDREDSWGMADSWLNHSPTIFGTGISIVPIYPLIDLGTELYSYLKLR